VLLGERDDERMLPSTRSVLRVVLIVLAVVGILLLIRMLWVPIAWLILATFLAIALSGRSTSSPAACGAASRSRSST